jgi:hypothetical protein
MAISVFYWANYVANKANMSRKSEYAVDDNNVLRFLLDAASCLHITATCMMKVARSTALIITCDTVNPVRLSVCRKR